MSVTRGDFLKSLGKSLPSIVLGSGVAVTAQKFLSKLAAATGDGMQPGGPAGSMKPPALMSTQAEFIHSGPTEGNRVALTFDDGPTPGVTDRILDELKQRGLLATFFMIGQCVAAAPDLARRVLDEGHTAANHTYTHPRLTSLSESQAADEIQKTQELMASLLNHRPAWFRPPFGALRQDQAPLANSRGLRIVMWNVDPADWSQPGEDKIIGTILRDTKPGSIIVCHDKYPQTANALGPMLDGLRERGFSPVTMTALME
jgi:peptidoglycan/xylan/chitin deacetylase (PgdA/CDA1 family)